MIGFGQRIWQLYSPAILGEDDMKTKVAHDMVDILKTLSRIDGLNIETADLFARLKSHLEKEPDAKKRKRLVTACDRKDTAVIRDAIFD